MLIVQDIDSGLDNTPSRLKDKTIYLIGRRRGDERAGTGRPHLHSQPSNLRQCSRMISPLLPFSHRSTPAAAASPNQSACPGPSTRTCSWSELAFPNELTSHCARAWKCTSSRPLPDSNPSARATLVLCTLEISLADAMLSGMEAGLGTDLAIACFRHARDWITLGFGNGGAGCAVERGRGTISSKPPCASSALEKRCRWRETSLTTSLKKAAGPWV